MRLTVLGAGVLVAAVFAAYANSLHVPLQFDDVITIGGNPSLHGFAAAWSPPPGTTVAGRPVLNLSFALNHAVGGTQVEGYHAVNLLIHALAALTLWGGLRRTLVEATPSSLQFSHAAAERPGAGAGRRSQGNEATRASLLRAEALSFTIALLWALHPLQTEAVTYLSQRAESLMGLFYLLTLYGFIRAARAAEGTRLRWQLVSIAACWLGMGTKEAMVSAPLIVFGYDAVFVAGGWKNAWRARRAYYVALAASWVPLAYEVVRLGGSRGGSTGLKAGVGFWDYLGTQPGAVLHYLRLVVWPRPLVFDYGPLHSGPASAVIPAAGVVLGLLVAAGVAAARRRPEGFAGIWFFAILAPTSLVPGALQMWSEHRMYLASAVVIAVVVLGIAALAQRLRVKRAAVGLALAGAAAAATLATLTHARNVDYATTFSLWADTVAKRPGHAMAHYNLANEWSHRPDGETQAIAEYERALQLDPDLSLVHYNLAVALETIPGRMPEAVEHYRRTVALDPTYVAAYNNLAVDLIKSGRPGEAVPYLRQAVQLMPDSAPLRQNLAYAEQAAGMGGTP